MITYQLTSMAMGIALSAVILFLVRRDHLHGPYSLWWIGAAATVALLGLFPRLFDLMARELGISYPPILAVVLGFSLLLVKILTMDLERSRQERLIRRLTQRLAMLEARTPTKATNAAEDSLPSPAQVAESTDLPLSERQEN